ncbi:MAG: tetratricopeptide repeat protein [Spirochaetia bacterium]|nr:tetratricopeptide repeat protein [Spirochaetia bacterium]
MPKKDTGKKTAVKQDVATQSVTETKQPRKATLFEKVTGTLIIAGLLAGGYMLVDNATGWGNTGKVIKKRLEAAEKAAIYKKYDEAAQRYEKIVAKWGNDERYKEQIKQARLSLAKTLKDAEQNIKAIEMYKQLCAEYKDTNNDMYAWLQLELAECYNSILNSDEAIVIYSAIVKNFEGSDWAAEALFGIAESYKLKKDYPNAVKYYDMIVEKYQKGFLSAEALTNKGRIYEELGREAQAVKVYEKVIREFPEIVTEYAKMRYSVLTTKTLPK